MVAPINEDAASLLVRLRKLVEAAKPYAPLGRRSLLSDEIQRAREVIARIEGWF